MIVMWTLLAAGCQASSQDDTGAATPLSAGDWENVYTIHALYYATLDQYIKEVSSRGINVVIQNILLQADTGDPLNPGWRPHYDLAVKYGVKLVPVLWDGSKDTSTWEWNAGADEFELDINKYPNSVGAQFLQFLRDNPAYLAHTWAVYSFHEPFNPANGKAQRTVHQQQRLWQQFHAAGLRLYGESVTETAGCANGCIDIAGFGTFNFSECGGKATYTDDVVEPAAMGVDIASTYCVTDEAKTIADTANGNLEGLYNWSHSQPPAPDGSYTKYHVLVQTFIAPLPEVSRMPTAAEMRTWGTQVVAPHKNHVTGMGWYPWRQIAGSYTAWLQHDRYDSTGGDRWQAITDVGNALFSGSSPPTGDMATQPTGPVDMATPPSGPADMAIPPSSGSGLKVTTTSNSALSQLVISSAAFGGGSATRTFKISGQDGLVWSVQSDEPWLTVTPSSGSGTSLVQVQAALHLMGFGTNRATVTVSSNQGSHSFVVTATCSSSQRNICTGG
jgi:hypothetical protein